MAVPAWLPVYPGSKPEGVSVAIDPQTGNRVGSCFFRTSDEIKQGWKGAAPPALFQPP
jgi:hypothetical protein